ncbi:ABC transporter permease [Serpentinicella sp. ANB-PHB4]|uniref:ABC transporter permease n=1 Tax=Serpentinicella sp. ANB-PHB4 TaxID=3074076 RepID=UPI00285AC54A|nr:ABC transporter permease [Serpentinicella sp. ANB-PHB4]MDR5658427.1 ABC transporter permease [Serpentinicella sp. ANB-PHB4]
MTKALFTNTSLLTRSMLKRDRIKLSIWIIMLVFFTLIIPPAFDELYPTDEALQAIAETMRNPAMTAMVGPGYGLDNYNIGAMMGHQMLLFTAIGVALMSIFLITRHTRADEEEGRIEMILSLPVGRLSNLGAATILSVIANVSLALIVGFGLYALGMDSMPLGPSLLYGTALGAVGIFFTGVTILFAQLSSTPRGALSFSFGVLGISYIMRAIGDVSNEALAVASPLGLILRTEVFVNNYWWPAIVTIAVGTAIGALGFYLSAARDLGAGILPAKPGRRHASRFLQSPLGLALRLQRTSIIVWIIGLFMLAVMYGSIFGDLEMFFEDNEIIQQMLPPSVGFSFAEQFVSVILSIVAILSLVAALIMLLRLKGEEKKNRTEHIYSCAVSRTNVMGAYFSISVFTAIVTLLISVIGLWAASYSVMDVPMAFGLVFKAGFVYLPAMLCILGFANLLLGYLPKATSLSWVIVFYSFVVAYFGQLLNFSDWAKFITPFGHIPNIPMEEVNVITSLVLVGLGAVFSYLGFIGYNKRDIQG